MIHRNSIAFPILPEIHLFNFMKIILWSMYVQYFMYVRSYRRQFGVDDETGPKAARSWRLKLL